MNWTREIEFRISTKVVSIRLRNYPGNFLLDTGATYVAVTPAYAAKAKLSLETGTRLPMKTVGGRSFDHLGMVGGLLPESAVHNYKAYNMTMAEARVGGLGLMIRGFCFLDACIPLSVSLLSLT